MGLEKKRQSLVVLVVGPIEVAGKEGANMVKAVLRLHEMQSQSGRTILENFPTTAEEKALIAWPN